MKALASSLSVCLVGLAEAATPSIAYAAPARVQCTVNIVYANQADLVDTYNKTFEVTRQEAFFDDISTRTRMGDFSAALVLEDALYVVIDYFKDVEVFGSTSLSTRLRIRGIDVVVSTSGRTDYSNSQAIPGGNHPLSWELTCHRMDPALSPAR